MSKRAQLQSLEPIVVVIFLAMIIGIMLVFYLRIGDAEGTKEQSVQENRKDLDLLKRMSRLPEISCPEAETGQTYCVDLYKAEAFGEAMESQRTKTSYYPLFGSVRITLHVIDAEYGAVDEVVIYDSINATAYVRPSVTYVSVYDPSDGTRKFGMIFMERTS
jgi:hypothetical protein